MTDKQQDTETRATLADFIARLKVEFKADRVPENPHMVDPQPDSVHYFCTFTRTDEGAFPRRPFRVYFSMGPGLVQRREGAQWKDATLPYNVRNVEQANEREHVTRWRPRPPDIAAVLDCLASDAAGYENARTFEEWASEYGYDTDSRKAERIYKTVGEQARALETFLGREDYNELLWKTERE